MNFAMKALALGTVFFLPLQLHEIYAADTSLVQDVKNAPSSFAPFLKNQTIYLAKHFNGIDTDQPVPYILPQNVSENPVVSIALSGTEDRLQKLVFAALNTTYDELVGHESLQKASLVEMMRKVQKVPFNNLNIEATKLFLADFSTQWNNPAHNLYIMVLSHLLNLSQNHIELQKDVIEIHLTACFKANIDEAHQSLKGGMSTSVVLERKVAFLDLYTRKMVELSSKGSKVAKEYVLGFYIHDSTQGQQLVDSIHRAVEKVHGSVDLVMLYGLNNSYLTTLTKIQTLDNVFLCNAPQYKNEGSFEQKHKEKEDAILKMIASPEPDAHAAIHNVLARRVKMHIDKGFLSDEDIAPLINDLKNQEAIYRNIQQKFSREIPCESAKLLIALYTKRLLSGEDVGDKMATLTFIEYYALRGYKEAQDALTKLMSPQPTTGIPLDRLFVLYNAGFLL